VIRLLIIVTMSNFLAAVVVFVGVREEGEEDDVVEAGR